MLTKDKLKKFFLPLFWDSEYNKRSHQLEDIGRMPAYVVVLIEPNAQVNVKIETLYPGTNHYKINETCYMVADKTFLTSEVTARLGLDGSGEGQPTGAVFSIGSFYHGFAPGDLWEWLNLKR